MNKVTCLALASSLFVIAGCDFLAPAPARLDADAGEDQVVAAGDAVSLSGTAKGGAPPYVFRWQIEQQPEDGTVALGDGHVSPLLNVGTIGVEGEYVFRLRVTDSAGTADASFVSVIVGGDLPVTPVADSTVRVVGESSKLGVEFDDLTVENLTYAWTVVRGPGELSDASAAEPTLTVQGEETVEVEVEVTGDVDGSFRFGKNRIAVVGVNDTTPQVVMQVDGGVTGEIVFELFTEAAPNTCANFLHYVDDEFFDGIVWHRVATDFVIQGGAFEVGEDGLSPRQGARDSVKSEANNGFSNLRSYVAMALRGEDADSGSNQFFVNLGDNSSLDGGTPPFTVFAQVIKGMAVVDEIAGVETETDASGLQNVPVEPIFMTTVRRAESEIEPEDIDTNGDVNSNGQA